MSRPDAQITITLTGGKLAVSGPIDDKFLCYAMLEGARDAVKDHNDAILKKTIIPANGRDMLDLQRQAGT